MNSKKASTSGYDGSDNVMHCNIVQVLQPARKYHFNDVCVCFTKDDGNYSFIQCLLQLPTIQYTGTYNLKKMTKAQMIAHVTHFHETQWKKRAEEVVVATITEKEVTATIQAKAYAKAMDKTIVCRVIIDLTNTGVMDGTGEVSNVAMVDEVEPPNPDPASKQSTTSNEATSREKGDHDVVIVHSTSFGPTSIKYAQPAIVTHDHVQDMVGQAMQSFVEC